LTDQGIYRAQQAIAQNAHVGDEAKVPRIEVALIRSSNVAGRVNFAGSPSRHRPL